MVFCYAGRFQAEFFLLPVPNSVLCRPVQSEGCHQQHKPESVFSAVGTENELMSELQLTENSGSFHQSNSDVEAIKFRYRIHPTLLQRGLTNFFYWAILIVTDLPQQGWHRVRNAGGEKPKA